MSNIEQSKQEIRERVAEYCRVIHTQNKEDFFALWSGDENDTLISVARVFTGTETIYENFLLGGIQHAYETIDLIADSEPEVHLVCDDTAVVVFQYHTECIRHETKEPFGIEGVETQLFVKRDGQWRLHHVHYSKR